MNGEVEDISVRRFCVVKRSRKAVSLEMKLRIIELAGSGESNTEIARKLELPRTTVVTILKDKARILETIECQTPMQTKYIRRQGKDNNLIRHVNFSTDFHIENSTEVHIDSSLTV
jgi:hypothetical protein